MALEINSLLAPVSDDAPAGTDLYDDEERREIETAFERPVSIDSSGQDGVDTDVEWRRIVGLIERQSRRTKDIWLAVYLCRAAARAGDLDLVSTGAAFLAGLCEQYWDTMFPALDEYGFQGRKGPCESLTSIAEFVRPLRWIPLIRHPRLGAYSGDDFERFQSEAEAADNYGLFRMALEETPESTLRAVASTFGAITTALQRVDTVLTSNSEGDGGVNFRATYDALSQIRQAVLSFVATPPTDEVEVVGRDQSASPSSVGTGSVGKGTLDSRDDVLRALDAISDYYRRKEPTSPMPLLMKRAREWVGLDFLEVLADIAPTGVDEARLILTSRPRD